MQTVKIPGNACKIPPEKFTQGKRLLKYAKLENWSNERIDEEVALMQVDCIGLRKCIKLPEAPQAYIDYHSQTYKVKKTFKKEFDNNPDIQNYLNKLGWVKNINSAKLYWLNIYVKIYEKKGMMNEVIKCQQLILEHHEVGEIPMAMENIQKEYFSQ